MSSLFHKPDVPELPPVVTESDERVKAAARAETMKMKKRRGYASTILTGPEGVTEPASTFKTKLGE